jgi:hypothetical protein
VIACKWEHPLAFWIDAAKGRQIVSLKLMTSPSFVWDMVRDGFTDCGRDASNNAKQTQSKVSAVRLTPYSRVSDCEAAAQSYDCKRSKGKFRKGHF